MHENSKEGKNPLASASLDYGVVQGLLRLVDDLCEPGTLTVYPVLDFVVHTRPALLFVCAYQHPVLHPAFRQYGPPPLASRASYRAFPKLHD